jgi:3-hydroxymyristoyl/3-hydroxydecanoyl-(acyl carrier protein) dehydratase
MKDEHARPSLPHAYPFVLLDRVLGLERGVSAVAIKNLARDDPLLDADGSLPPVLLAEALAQAAGLAAFAAAREEPGTVDRKPETGNQAPPGTTNQGPGTRGVPAALVRIRRFRARPWVGAGDQLRVSVRVRKILGGTAMVRGVVHVSGRIHAAGEVVLQQRTES